ncbi:uncharacterized protein FIBRA_05222 [Fibroporia radiculosa]|uniref:Uncharacterized protein n=1 Tax=Fibroporia radiculosa TaxID=599839 RepID=J4HX58_9APHY|nr:uncharacterized protein FIBRA_05222 [Fibroporia radiculosa]CCM03102.1 predicted protein [Fibroporia radiculosa]
MFAKDVTNIGRAMSSRTDSSSVTPSLTPDYSQGSRANAQRSASRSTLDLPTRRASPAPKSAHNLSPQSRRQLRYGRAQEALRTTFLTCASEPSPTDQQIHALERATAFLSAQARDARERATKLRACLADKVSDEVQKLGAGAYQAMLRERWMAERRCAAREEQARALQICLTQLTTTNVDGSSLRGASNVSAATVAGRSPGLQTRRKTNLTHFLERSPTRTAFPHRSRASPVHHAITSPRRKTISRVRSLRLRASACAFSMSHVNAHHTRADSQDDRADTPTLCDRSGSPPPSLAPAQPSMTSAAHDPRSLPPAQPHTSTLATMSPATGIAHIFAAAHPRTKAEILAQLAHDEHGAATSIIPGYAVDLLDELVATELDVSLRPVLPPPSTARTGFSASTLRGASPSGSSTTNSPESSGASRSSESSGTARELSGRGREAGQLGLKPHEQAQAAAAPTPAPVPTRPTTHGAPPAPSSGTFRRSLHLGSLHPAARAKKSSAPADDVRGRASASLSSVPESVGSRVPGEKRGSFNSYETRKSEAGLVSRVRNRLSGLGRR